MSHLCRPPEPGAHYEVTYGGTEEALAEAVHIWARNLPRPQQLKGKVGWYYERSPSQARVVLLKCDQQPVGAEGLVPRRFLGADGTALRAGHLSDLAVDPCHRSLGPALALQKKAVTGGLKEFDFLLGFPSPPAEPVLRRAGFRMSIPLPRNALALRSDTYLRASRLGPLSTVVAPIADACLSGVLTAATAARKRGYHLLEVASFDAQFENLWGSCANHGLNIGVRDRDFLTWRFSSNPIQRFRTFSLLDSTRALAGYVVVQTEDDPAHWQVVDILARSHAPRAFKALLTLLAGVALREGAHSVSMEFLGPGRLRNTLPRLGYFPRGADRTLLLAAPNERHSQLTDGPNDSWYVTAGDELG